MIARLMGLDTISPRDLHQRMQQGGVTAIDVNPRASWIAARLPGAVQLPVEFEDSDLPRDKSATLVFYCSNPLCRKAPNAARRAEKRGYTNVLVLSAGIRGWLDSGLPTESGESGAAF